MPPDIRTGTATDTQPAKGNRRRLSSRLNFPVSSTSSRVQASASRRSRIGTVGWTSVAFTEGTSKADSGRTAVRCKALSTSQPLARAASSRTWSTYRQTDCLTVVGARVFGYGVAGHSAIWSGRATGLGRSGCRKVAVMASITVSISKITGTGSATTAPEQPSRLAY